MTPEEMAAVCAQSIVAGLNVTFALPKGEKFPPGWPRGELLCVTEKGRAYSFDPLKILAFMQKMAKIK